MSEVEESQRERRKRLILAEVRAIPRGYVATYGQIAEQSGLARQARLVGRVLGELEAGDDTPWHRVIAASGRISLSPSSSSYIRQVERLTAEGVNVVNGRINLRKFRWTPDMDELIWKPPT